MAKSKAARPTFFGSKLPCHKIKILVLFSSARVQNIIQKKTGMYWFVFYVHGSVHRESMSTIVQQDATIQRNIIKLYIVASCWTIIDILVCIYT